MKRRNFVLAFVVLAVITAIVYLSYNRKLVPPTKPLQVETAISTTAVANQSATHSPSIGIVTNAIIQEPPYSAPLPERVAWWKEMGKRDWHFEYKMPLSFFGKIVDDQGQPVVGANIKFSWFDLSSEGTGHKNAVSDANGLFSLNGAAGKSLGVQVSKEGFKCWISKNTFNFENGILSDHYYNPDPMNPVVFVLRKNREAETLLVRKTQEVQLEAGQGKSFPIGAGDVFINVERLSGEITNNHARYWNARVTVPNGGLSLTTEEFPFEAPENGYTNEYVITRETPHPPMGDLGGMFYVKTQAGYGRVSVTYVMNSPWVYVDSWFNPNPNSRNLELDPAKVIKLH